MPPPPLYKLGMRFDHTKGMCCAFLPGFGRKIGLNFSEDLFFCSSPNFGPKIGLNLSGTISDSDLYFSQIFSNFWPPPFENPAYATAPALQRVKRKHGLFLLSNRHFLHRLEFLFFFRFCV